MTLPHPMRRMLAQDGLNFLLTNRLPRRSLNRLMGRISRMEQPLIRDTSIALWRLFSDLDLSEADTTQFGSMHDCFTRRLKPGARPVAADPGVLVSPCDAIVGAHGTIHGTDLLQIKGRRYALGELLRDDALVERHRGGRYATLRLKSSMYHRFHAPHDCRVETVHYIPGDTWNVNPPALRRVDKLFCKNERAVLRTTLSATGHAITLVPVGAILVAGIRLNFVDLESWQAGGVPRTLPCSADFRKGDEMGWFEHGSTIVVFAPDGFSFCANVREGEVIRMGQPLLRLP